MKYLISYGLSNLHVCKDNEIPIPLVGAIEIELDIPIDDYESCYIRNKNIEIKFNRYSKASGSLTLVGLDTDAKELLFGIKKDSRGGIRSGINDNPPHLHLLLQQELSDGSKNLTHLYDVQFLQNSLSSRTVDEDITINEITLDFECFYNNQYESYYYTINSSTCTDLYAIDNFFNELIYPID